MLFRANDLERSSGRAGNCFGDKKKSHSASLLLPGPYFFEQFPNGGSVVFPGPILHRPGCCKRDAVAKFVVIKQGANQSGQTSGIQWIFKDETINAIAH